MSEPEISGQLTLFERDRLAELEAVVERGLQTFVDVGLALTEIRDSRLYRETYSTFVEYLDQRWSMSESHGYRLIDGAAVAELVSPMGEIPNERQARELVPLLDDEVELVNVWRELKTKHGDKLTAEKVRTVVTERLGLEGKIGTLVSTGSVEWYTPTAYIADVRNVLGDIDLDPASCAFANETVQAVRYYDAASDGLSHAWEGRVFLNPPYGPLCGQFVAKAIEEYENGRTEAVLLLLNGYSFDARWFHPLWDYPLCFTYRRLDFYSPERTLHGGTTGSIFVYLGPDPDRFAEVFDPRGAVLERRSRAA